MDPRLALFFASLMGIVPSYGLLVLGTWWYERKLDEKDLNISYIIGVFIGVVVVVAHLFFAVSYGFTTLAIPAAFLLGLLEILIYRAYLNRSKLKGRSDQPFIAFSLALGISGAYILFITGQYFRYENIDVENLLGLIMFTLGVPLTRAGVAIMFSSDRSRGVKLSRALILPSLVLSFFNLMIMFYLLGNFLWPFSMAGVLIGIAIFYFTFKRLRLVPDMKNVPSDNPSA